MARRTRGAHHQEAAMSSISESVTRARAAQAPALVGWLLVLGGVLYFVGGSMHPKQDPEGVSLKEHMRVMYEDSAWYPAHIVFLAGMVLLAAALVVLARS